MGNLINTSKEFEQELKRLLSLTEGKTQEEINLILSSCGDCEEDNSAILELCQDTDAYHQMRKDLLESGLDIIAWVKEKIMQLLKVENPNITYSDLTTFEEELSAGKIETPIETISEKDFNKLKELGIITDQNNQKENTDSLLVKNAESIFDEGLLIQKKD